MKTESFIYELDCSTKQEAIEKMIRSLEVEDFDKALNAVLEREKLASTCIEHCVAIPHGKTDAVKELSYVCARSAKSIDWDDGRKASIIILTLSPENSCGPHVIFLSHIAKLLENEEIRHQIENASSAEEMKEAFSLI